MIKAVTGTKDLLPSEIPNWKFLESGIEKVFRNFNYQEIRSPFSKRLFFLHAVSEKRRISWEKKCTLSLIEAAKA
jgi:histidyl-tRNA synthetase